MDQINRSKKAKRKGMKQNKPCYNCSSRMQAKRTTLHFERGHFYADVENVPAYVCPSCGTRSIPGPAAKRISELVNDLFCKASSDSEKQISFTGVSMHRIAG